MDTDPLDTIKTPEAKQLGIFLVLSTKLLEQLAQEAPLFNLSLEEYVERSLEGRHGLNRN